MSIEIFKEKVDKAKRVADAHYKNYEVFYAQNNLVKSSEFLWGTINQLFYAVGLYHNKKLSTHAKIRRFLPIFAQIYNDEEIVEEGFESAFVLHSNFYHDHLEKESFEFHKEKVEKLILKLLDTLENL